MILSFDSRPVSVNEAANELAETNQRASKSVCSMSFLLSDKETLLKVKEEGATQPCLRVGLDKRGPAGSRTFTCMNDV